MSQVELSRWCIQISASTTNVAPTSSSTNTSAKSDYMRESLSPGAAAGIAIDAFAFLLCIAAAVWDQVRRRRRTPRNPHSTTNPTQQSLQHESLDPNSRQVVEQTKSFGHGILPYKEADNSLGPVQIREVGHSLFNLPEYNYISATWICHHPFWQVRHRFVEPRS